MNIYFACSVTGGRKDESKYQQIVAHLEKQGHQVPTAILASSDAKNIESNADPVEVYDRDVKWIRECDILIAEISTPSHGVGYEIGYALERSKPVICLHQYSTCVSKMITGNRDSNLTVFSYQHIEEALRFIDERLKTIMK
jgi:nucleoside 2-deoxyribosyltransferase